MIRTVQPFTAARAAEWLSERVIFFHIPKTAGSTVNAHFKGLLGSSWQGQALTVSDRSTPEDIAIARRARFVGGHYGTALLSALGPGLRITVLRDPLERLVSAWRFQQTLKAPLPFETLEDALAADHPEVRRVLDNVQSRHLASPRLDAPPPREEWLERAQATLSGIDVILWQWQFDDAFRRLLSNLDLPAPAQVGRANVTGAIGRRPPPKVSVDQALKERAAPYIALDQALLAKVAGKADL